jgi:TFIIF-interacting CTD phosphatase-like protein
MFRTLLNLFVPLEPHDRWTASRNWRRYNTFHHQEQEIMESSLDYSSASDSSLSTNKKKRNRKDAISRHLHLLKTKKTLVLDLDETLVHSTSQSYTRYDFTVEVMIDKQLCLYYVYKRPHVDYFLKKAEVVNIGKRMVQGGYFHRISRRILGSSN